MFLDQAEFRAQRRQNIFMDDWQGFLDKFLGDVDLPVLEGAGSVRHHAAVAHAKAEYDKFAEKRRLEEQQEADQNYIEDLKSSAEVLKREREK
jgi:hypothetical protein